MNIENNILKHYLKNVYFITGTAYAGKSTIVKMLADRYDMVFCGENYYCTVSDIVATPDVQPDLCYRKSLTDWKDFVTRSPEEYERWIYSSGKESAGFEVAELISISKNRKVIADTNIPIELLKEISDYNHVAVMLSPQSMSVERFLTEVILKNCLSSASLTAAKTVKPLWIIINVVSHLLTAKSTMTNMQRVVFSPLFGRITEKIPEKKSAMQLQSISA